jgi:hypothetical protein
MTGSETENGANNAYAGKFARSAHLLEPEGIEPSQSNSVRRSHDTDQVSPSSDQGRLWFLNQPGRGSTVRGM